MRNGYKITYNSQYGGVAPRGGVRNGCRANKKGQSGFTLIEVLVAMVVLTAGLLAIAGAFNHGMLILVNTPTQLAAKELAYEIIDDYVIRKDTGISNTSGWLTLNSKPITTRDGRNFHVSASSSDSPANCGEFSNPAPDRRQVDVTVTYCATGGLSCLGSSRERRYRVTACVD